jgi:hypothetical protein
MVMMEVANWEGRPCVVDPAYDPSVCGFDRPSSSSSAAAFPGFDPTAPCVPISGCGTWLAYPFFMSFYWFLSFIVLNLFTAVILLEFQKATATAQQEKKADEKKAREELRRDEGVAMHAREPLKKGYLVKQGAIVRSWRKRFFILSSEGDLYYLENEEAGIPKG